MAVIRSTKSIAGHQVAQKEGAHETEPTCSTQRKKSILENASGDILKPRQRVSVRVVNSCRPPLPVVGTLSILSAGKLPKCFRRFGLPDALLLTITYSD